MVATGAALLLSFFLFSLVLSRDSQTLTPPLTTTYEPGTTDAPQPVFAEFKNSWITPLMTAGLLVMGVAILGFNAIVFSFYFTKRDNVLHNMYMFLSVSDIVSGIGAVFQAMTLLVITTNNLQIARYLCPIAFFFSTTTSHVSVFYSTLLVVIRTINIVMPLHQVCTKAVFAAVVVYPIIWISIAAFEIGSLYWPEYPFPPFRQAYYLLVAPNTGSEILFRLGSEWFYNRGYVIFIVCAGIPFFLPSAITVICCVLQIVTLNSINIDGKAAQRNHKITITILQLTCIFFVCNTAHFTTLFIFEIVQPAREKAVWMWYTLYIVGNILPFLNSLLNPFILIIRGKSLRDYASIILNVTLKKDPVEAETKLFSTYGGTTFKNAQSPCRANLTAPVIKDEAQSRLRPNRNSNNLELK